MKERSESVFRCVDPVNGSSRDAVSPSNLANALPTLTVLEDGSVVQNKGWSSDTRCPDITFFEQMPNG